MIRRIPQILVLLFMIAACAVPYSFAAAQDVPDSVVRSIENAVAPAPDSALSPEPNDTSQDQNATDAKDTKKHSDEAVPPGQAKKKETPAPSPARDIIRNIENSIRAQKANKKTPVIVLPEQPATTTPVIIATSSPATTTPAKPTRMATTTATTTGGAYTRPLTGILASSPIGRIFFPAQDGIYRSSVLPRGTTFSLLALALAFATTGVLLLVRDPLRRAARAGSAYAFDLAAPRRARLQP